MGKEAIKKTASNPIPLVLCNSSACTQLFCYTLCLLLHRHMVWSNPRL